jgi:membrane protein YqaA with SNARE-associated domain
MTIFQSLLYRVGLMGFTPVDSSRPSFSLLDVEASLEILRRHSEIVWLLPFLATAGSVLGAAIVFWIGRKIGANGLDHFISPGVLERVRGKVTDKGAVALVLPALLPPPFPLMPFVLACGALSVSATRFFILFASLRMVRFSILTALAWFYGRQILTVFQTETFKTVVVMLLVVFVVGISVAVYGFVTKVHGHHKNPPPSTKAGSRALTRS